MKLNLSARFLMLVLLCGSCVLTDFRDNQQGSLGGAHHLRKRLQL